MVDKAFVDTNILVYAHDFGSGIRHDRARATIERLWQSGAGVISTQVLQEFYVNVRRKARQPIEPAEVKRLITDYRAWELVINDDNAILEAIDIERQYTLSFWDALIVQAANVAGAPILYSEDLGAGQIYGGTRVVNPLVI